MSKNLRRMSFWAAFLRKLNGNNLFCWSKLTLNLRMKYTRIVGWSWRTLYLRDRVLCRIDRPVISSSVESQENRASIHTQRPAQPWVQQALTKPWDKTKGDTPRLGWEQVVTSALAWHQGKGTAEKNQDLHKTTVDSRTQTGTVHGLQSHIDLDSNLASLTSYMTSGRLHSLPGPQFLHLQ